MSLNVKEKNEWIFNNFDLINAIRRCHTNDKKLLARTLKLSWPTLNNMIIKMFDYDSNPISQNEKGVYRINPQFGYFVGLSIGGLETQLSILDFTLSPINNVQDNNETKKIKEALMSLKAYKAREDSDALVCFETPQYPQDLSTLCNKIINIVLDVFEQSNHDLLGIGLTFPGILSSDKNNNDFKVVFCPNLSRLVGLSLIDLFDKRVLKKIYDNNISFVLSHDTDAATVFEKENLYKASNRSLYEHCNKSNYACIYLDVGLGMGLIINNTLLKGSCHSVGEIGHLIAPALSFDNEDFSEKESKTISNIQKNKSNYSCYCGVKNCLEHELRTKVFGCDSQKEFLEKTSNEKLTAFHKNYSVQYKIFKQYISYLMNLLINILNVDVIILSGRIFNKMTPLKYDVELIKMSSGLAPSTNACKVVFGSERTDVVALGGATMAYHNLKTQSELGYNTDKKLNIVWPIIKHELK